MENIDSNFCLRLKLKLPNPQGMDMWLLCMQSDEARSIWLKSFWGVILNFHFLIIRLKVWP